MASETQQTVELQRSVRIGRLLIVGAVVGAILGALITTLFPVPEKALYTMGQIAGFMLVVGGVLGLALGALLALILSAVAKRQRGTAVAEQVVAHEEPAQHEEAAVGASEIADGEPTQHTASTAAGPGAAADAEPAPETAQNPHNAAKVPEAGGEPHA